MAREAIRHFQWDVNPTINIETGEATMFRLRGTFKPWETREMTALCSSINRFGQSQAKSFSDECLENHECGIYSLRPGQERIKGTGTEQFTITANCLVWGKGVEGDRGYRSEFARIEHLNIDGVHPVNLCKELQSKY